MLVVLKGRTQGNIQDLEKLLGQLGINAQIEKSNWWQRRLMHQKYKLLQVWAKKSKLLEAGAENTKLLGVKDTKFGWACSSGF